MHREGHRRISRPVPVHVRGDPTVYNSPLYLLRAIDQLREKADESDELQRPLGIILDKLVGAWIAQTSDSARKHHHEAKLLIPIALVCQLVEPEIGAFGEKTFCINGVPSRVSPLRIRTKPFSALTASSMALA